MHSIRSYIRLMRPKHYIKNLLILLPLFFGGQMTNAPLLIKTLLGFAAFCLISSAVYVINDIRDAPRDRLHPTKKERPIASGTVGAAPAWTLFVLLFLFGLALNALAADAWQAWAILIGYFLINLAYSFGLKDVPIVDIAILVAGFLLRVLYGSALTGIEISKWLYLTVIAVSFYLGLGKRRNELAVRPQNGAETRKVLKSYSFSFLDKGMYMCLTLAIGFYSLWSVDAETIARIGTENLVWTVPLVILICLKYSLTVEGASDGDPVEVILSDKWLLLMVAALALLMLAIIYC